ncbi:protein-S-isoprenylcysteine O-methyltransferase Ste14 [Lentimicrobium saccharophilum]|uniref:Protein-S-isoprenylcysteine O-methyltransferase Ste14 n=2 Tax=Lentimicrobium saccharophilum TaxID=1678841 RepID=A0A0S7C5N9_9BACT|nr:protein-S-isoprenylcysteine O-methyltransferase Ste14 [Lentimicrobium saccharophilum]
MNLVSMIFLPLLLLLFAYLVFRILVRRVYLERGRLSVISSGLQLVVFAGYFGLGYLFNPPEWIVFWMIGSASSRELFTAGFLIVCIGLVVAFGTMFWFGIGRAFGVHQDGLKKTGPYRLSRNPQVIGGYLLVAGTSLQWPSLYAIGWILIYAVIAHWMIITEEEHLHRLFGEEYQAYCAEVPRYLRVKMRAKGTAPD